MQTGEVSETLRVVFYPFTYTAAVGCGILTLVFALSLLRDLLTEARRIR